jgi:hypothetical protein
MDKEDEIGKLPQTLLQFRERQKELKKRNEEKRNSNNVFSNEETSSSDDVSSLALGEESRAVSLIEESVFLSSKILSSSEDKSDLSKKFSKFFKQQKDLLTIAEEELLLDFNNDSHKTLLPRLGKVLTEIIYENKDLSNEKLQNHFKELCHQVNIHKEFWSGNENIAPLLSIRARVSTFEAAIKIWNGVNHYPFSKDIDNTSIKIFTFVINLSRDIALNWEEELGSLERQQLYVSMVPIVADIAVKSWERFSINSLDNSYSTIDKSRLDLGKKIIDILEPSVVGISKANDFSDTVTEKIMIETEKYSNIFYHMERKSLNIVRKTIFKKIEKNVFQYIKDNQSDIIKKVKNDPDYADFITEQIEQIIEQSPPRVIANIDEYHEELKDSVVQAWGAAQGIYKFRRS